MVNPQSPGIYPVKRRAGVVTIQGVSTSIGGFTGKAEKGPINRPVRMSGDGDFTRIFGGKLTDSYLYDQVIAFFQMGGGTCYVTRVMNQSDPDDASTLTGEKASVTLSTLVSGDSPAELVNEALGPHFGGVPDSNGEISLDVELDVDGGGASTESMVGDCAEVLAANSGPFALTDGMTLLIEEGSNSFVVTFLTAMFSSIGAATAAEIRAAILAQTTRVRVYGSSTTVGIRTQAAGTGQSIRVTGGTANAILGFGTTLQTGTGDFANSEAITNQEVADFLAAAFAGVDASLNDDGYISLVTVAVGTSASLEMTASGFNLTLLFPSSLAEGSDQTGTETMDVIMAWEGAAGNEHGVEITRSEAAVAVLATAIPIGNVTSIRVSSSSRLRVGDQISIADSFRSVITRISGTTVDVVPVTTTSVTDADEDVVSETFGVRVYEGTSLLSSFDGLRMSSLAEDRYVGNVIRSSDDPTALLDVSLVGLTATHLVDPRPSELGIQLLTGGDDGDPITSVDLVGTSAAGSGLYAHDPDLINMISIPGETAAYVISGIETYVDRMYDLGYPMLGVSDLPDGITEDAAVAYVQNTVRLSSDNIASWFPWVKATNIRTRVVENVPTSGYVQGCVARTHRRRNVAKAPAGVIDGKLRGVNNVARKVPFPSGTDVLYQARINPVLAQQEGVLLWGSRTHGQAGDLRQINKVLSMAYFQRSIKKDTRWIVFEGNNPDTRADWTRAVRAFCRRAWFAGILIGETADDAFYIICDDSNNPPSVEQAGFFYGRVGLRFPNTIEFAIYEYEEDLRALQAELNGTGG